MTRVHDLLLPVDLRTPPDLSQPVQLRFALFVIFGLLK